MCRFETAQKVPLQAASIKAALPNVSQASTAHEQSLRSHRCVALKLFLIDKCAQEAALRKQNQIRLFKFLFISEFVYSRLKYCYGYHEVSLYSGRTSSPKAQDEDGSIRVGTSGRRD